VGIALAALVSVAGPGAKAVVDSLVLAGGRARKDASGRAIVLFDGPARAVRAALAHRRDDAGVGVAVAEVERDADVVRAHGVTEAVDLADAVPLGEVWLSGTVGVLLAGSSIAVEPAGTAVTGGRAEQPVLRPV
jgi:hypothetical protein